MDKPQGKVLFVDDELNILKAIKRIFHDKNCYLEIMMDPIKAMNRLEEVEFDVICSDYNMPKLDGVSFLRNAKQLYPESMRILMSGKADFDALSNAINEAEIYRFISKPFDNYEFLFAINQAIENKYLLDENTRLNVVVKEHKNKILLQQKEIEKLASTDARSYQG